MEMELNRAHEAEAQLADEVDELKARLVHADEHTMKLVAEWAEMRQQFHRAHDAEARLADEVDELQASLKVAETETERAKGLIVELRQNLRQCKQQYEQLHGNWTELCEQWANLQSVYNRVRSQLAAQLAARNSPRTTQGSQTISNEYRVGVSHTLC